MLIMEGIVHFMIKRCSDSINLEFFFRYGGILDLPSGTIYGRDEGILGRQI